MIYITDEMLTFMYYRVSLWAHKMNEEHHEHDLLAPPKGRYAMMWHITVYPFKYLFKKTLVDCRIPKYRAQYGSVILIATIWLAVLSYIMILCSNFIGNLIGASPIVMGLTLAAIGTSFPNLVSSMLVAKQGYGNMAICNALGSNVFNMDVALGFPWLVYLLSRNGDPYNQMPNGGITMYVVLLEVVCVIWIAMIWWCDFQMRAWMAWWYILIYIVVMVAAIALT